MFKGFLGRLLANSFVITHMLFSLPVGPEFRSFGVYLCVQTMVFHRFHHCQVRIILMG